MRFFVNLFKLCGFIQDVTDEPVRSVEIPMEPSAHPQLRYVKKVSKAGKRTYVTYIMTREKVSNINPQEPYQER